MKRSEMIKVIKDYLDLVQEEDGLNPTTEDMAEYILGCCEVWGMLPPTVEFKMAGKNMRDNTWEAEVDSEDNS